MTKTTYCLFYSYKRIHMEMLNEIKTDFIITMNDLWLFTGPRMLLTKERD